jgi:hypothetical protein
MPGRATGVALALGGDFAPAFRVMADARKQGHDFDSAWPMAIKAVRPDDRATLRETCGAWRAEFERRRSYGGDLMSAMALVLDHDEQMTP